MERFILASRIREKHFKGGFYPHPRAKPEVELILIPKESPLFYHPAMLFIN